MKIGDYVARKKYGKDIVFQIIAIENSIAYLRGLSFRLCADSELSDLEKVEYTETTDVASEIQLEDNRESIIKGKILHLDGDELYLDKCLRFYKEQGVPVTGAYSIESHMKEVIVNLLVKHRPDILVITGHDSFSERRGREYQYPYENSKNFIDTVKAARTYQADKDALVIFAGACQSDYEGLIMAGANFASSPERTNIHALDPAFIVTQVARVPIKDYIDIEGTLRRTVSKGRGLGGIDTRGVARKLYIG